MIFFILFFQCIQAGTSTTCISKLIKAGAGVNEADRQGRTPLHEAAERGRSDVVALLQTHGANVEAVEMVETHTTQQNAFQSICFFLDTVHLALA